MVDFPLAAMLVFWGVSKNSPKVSGTKIGGTVPNQAVLRMVFFLHKPYPYSLHR